MKQIVTLLALALLVMPATNWGASAKPMFPYQSAQPDSPVELWTAEEYKDFYDASATQDMAKKIQLFEQFTTKYPGSALVPLVRRNLVFAYLQTQDLAKAFQAGDAYLNSHHEKYAEAFDRAYGDLFKKAEATLPMKPTDDFDVLINLIVASNGAARAKNTSFDTQTKRYIELASNLIKPDSPPPTMPKARWTGNENAFQAVLQQTVGLMSFNHAGFKLTNRSLDALKSEGVSEAVTGKLTSLLDREFDALDKLNSEVQALVGAQEMATLKPLLGKYAVNRQPYYQAAEHLAKAAALAPTDPVTFYLWGEACRLGKYADLRDAVDQTQKEYNNLSGQLKQIETQVKQINDELTRLSKAPRQTEQTKNRIEELSKQGQELAQKGESLTPRLDQLEAENDRLVEETNQLTDQMIRIYAKAVALSANVPPLQQNARSHLERYYKYRNKGVLDGLPALIERMKTEQP
ncbi:MAG: hypothetical protein RMM98_05565 [Acidobacteriota bacterium]|nr:hypothetical protein [Blastocatellia bacterium]MDW8239063.1 hypothetical protein [Acidobacteriota bacterium]